MSGREYRFMVKVCAKKNGLEHSALLFFSSNHMYKEYMSATYYVGVGYENQKTMNLADHLKKSVGLG